MLEERVESVSAALTDRFGDDLRSVAGYDADGFHFAYIRDDVERQYDERDHLRVFRTLRLEAMEGPHLDSLFEHGDLECTVRAFESATVLHVFTSETDGVLVSVDAGAVADLRSVVSLLSGSFEPATDGKEADTS